ncbi:MAG TPA: hypothetical protein PKC40_09355, partial [Saprospiraceae bacterium]|nr:hypothetical protein [Saprospiraceae bacterium]
TWLVFFASFAAVLLFKYNEDKDLVTRLEYAKELAKWEDPYAEEEFERLTSMLEEDPLIVKLLFSDSLQRAASLKQLEKQIDNVYSNHSYLFNIYSYSFAIEAAGDTTTAKTRFLDADKNISYFTDKLSQAKATKYPDIFYWTAPQQLFSYLSPIFISDPNNPKKGVFIYFEIQKRLREPSMVYTELILTQSYKKLDNLFRYDYAIYQNDNLVEQNDIVYDTKISGYPVPLQGTGKEEIFGNRSEFGYHAPDGTVVILGRQVRSLLKPISLFSYVFLLLLVTVVLIAVVNTFAKMLPEVLQLTIWQKPSLKTKIQLSIITVIVASFIMIGWVTVVYFRNTSNEYHETRLLRRLNSVLLNIEHEIQLKSELGEEEPDFEKMIKEINPIHRMDINIFDLQGNLVTSTEMDIFNKGIVGKKMGGVAYHAMARQNQVEFIQEEKIGMFDYKAAYVPLRGATGKVMGYVGLPYYTKQRNLRDDVYEFMGTLLNVYVFLLLIATTIAIFVANSITKPIAVIGDRFKRFKLGSHEPLVWNSRDELGELIDDYNRMIQKVMDSTEKLKQSEREGAWRTMAQQVAHEIKNPLTPMKLSIQYLQHALKNDPEKA